MALAPIASRVNALGRELKEHGTSLFPIACYDDDFSLGPVPWHWHDEWEALVVQQGEVLLLVDGRRYDLRAGEGIFINASALHGARGRRSTNCHIHSLVFHPRLVGAGIDSIFWQHYVQPILSNSGLRCLPLSPGVAWQQEAMDCISRAWAACAEETEAYELQARTALSQLAYLLCAHCPAAQSQPSEKSQRYDARIKTMLRYIRDHVEEELTVAHIAQSAAISESECLRCFREKLGTTPMRYVRQFRVQQAAELLRSSDLKIAEVAARCGFQEMSYFAKTFRELKGCTPSDYRSQQKRP